MEGTNSKITMFAHFKNITEIVKFLECFNIVCKLNSLDVTEKLPALFNLPFTFVHQ